MAPEGCTFVIARLEIDFRREMLWPGKVDVGTAVLSLGSSSMRLVQGLFVGDDCVATAATVVVQTDERTRRSTPLTAATRARLDALAVIPPQA
jgi:acyl-CoA thioester hydrolase